MRVPFLPLLLLAWPLAEIAAFVVIGKMIGVWATLAIVIGTGIVGGLLIRGQGLALVRQLSQEGKQGRAPGQALIDGAMVVIAGFLLLLPGLIADMIGAALLIPFVRHLLWAAIGRRVVIVQSGPQGAGRRPFSGNGPHQDSRPHPNGAGQVVDLDEGDFRREPKENSPWSKGREIDG